MIDLILFSFWVGTFCGGFWCGKTFKSAASMFKAAHDKMSGLFD